MADNHKVVMGRVASPYGVRGWTKVISFTQPIDNLLDYPVWEIQHQNQWQLISIEKGKVHGKWLIVKFAGCEDPETVKKYTNNLIAIPRQQMASLTTQEYYWDDLIGLTVKNIDGHILGKIDSLLATGANDVLVIKNAHNKEILIPYIKSVIKSVDLAQKIITVAWEDF